MKEFIKARLINAKIRIKKLVRKGKKLLPYIILTALVLGLMILGIFDAAEKVSDAYYETQIAPFVSVQAQSLTK